MLEKVKTASAQRRRVLAVLVVTVVLVPLGVAAAALDRPAGDRETPTAAAEEAEVRLDRLTPAELRREEVPPAPRRGRRPTVVQLVTPGGEEEVEKEATGGERPPDRILEQNAKLRQELDHLKALEAERRRVSRTLARAGVIYEGPLRIGAGGLAWPVVGPVVSPFGQRWGRLHAGVDIAAPAGTVIRAAETGGVALAAPTGGYGNYVCLQHSARLTTCYAHLSRFLTQRGAIVRQGEPIGLVGCTGHCFGDHLHFETWVGGRPVDPMPYL